MEILKFPHPSLFEKCVEVTVFGPELKALLGAMAEAMIKYNGVGLAANQVGLHYRMFVMRDKHDHIVNLVNPVIIALSDSPANIKEGCLSAPGEFFLLSERKQWVQVEFQDEKGHTHRRVFEDLYAVCVQHETDHLDGVCFLESTSIPKKIRKELNKKWLKK